MAALLSELSNIRVNALCNVGIGSYASRPLSDMPFVCTFTHNLKTTGRMWRFYQTTVLLFKTFLV